MPADEVQFGFGEFVPGAAGAALIDLLERRWGDVRAEARTLQRYERQPQVLSISVGRKERPTSLRMTAQMEGDWMAARVNPLIECGGRGR